MAHGTPLTIFTRAAAYASLVGLTIVLVFLGLVFARSGPGIWFVVAFIGIPLWWAVAILRRSDRWPS